MTEIELKMEHFAANGCKCKKHKAKAKLIWDGCHVIECSLGCVMSDGDNLSPDPLIMRWAQENR